MSETRKRARSLYLTTRQERDQYKEKLDSINARTDNRPLAFLELLEKRAKQISPDYPFENTDAFDWLWAIVSSYTGTEAANTDCHAFLRHLEKTKGIDVYGEWEEFRKNHKLQPVRLLED